MPRPDPSLRSIFFRRPAAGWRRVITAAFPLLLLSILTAGLAGCRGHSPVPFRTSAHPDIILITVDTLRADALEYAGNTIVKTPNIDRVAAEGIVFTDAHAQNVITLPSHINILTGLYPFEHGVRDNEGFVLNSAIPTMATFLHSAGYGTAAFVSGFPLDSRYGLSHDFDVYDQSFPQGAYEYRFIEPRRPSSQTVPAAQKWFDAHGGKPRFLWIHLYDCHSPYQPPSPFDQEYRDHPYLGDVAAVDRSLGPLFDDLRSQKRPFLLVFTADHGESLGEHGEETHGVFAYEVTLHVPLILWSPGHLKRGVDRGLARHIDILPTVLQAAGVKIPDNLPGRSLFHRPPDPKETSYFEALSMTYERGWAPLRGEIGEGYKYIDLPTPELYNLRNDPREQDNLYSRDAEMVRYLRNALLPDETALPAASPASAEEAAKLRSLGYLGGNAQLKKSYGEQDDPKRLVYLDSKLQRVILLYSRGQLPAAIALAKSVVAERPTMRTGYEYLSFMQGQEGDDAEAVHTLEEARRRGLLNLSLASRLGLLYSEMGRSKDALEILEPLRDCGNTDVLNALGIARADAGEFDASLAAFQAALAVDPRNAQSWQNIGITWLHHGNLPQAVAAFEKGLAINEELPRAWNAYGVALQEMGKTSEALAAWQKAVAQDPQQFDALFNIGVVAAQTGRPATARKAFEQYIRTAPPGVFAKEIAQARQFLARLAAAS